MNGRLAAVAQMGGRSSRANLLHRMGSGEG
jgi:hypothetical protein